MYTRVSKGKSIQLQNRLPLQVYYFFIKLIQAKATQINEWRYKDKVLHHF